MVVGDLQMGDKKVTLKHLGFNGKEQVFFVAQVLQNPIHFPRQVTRDVSEVAVEIGRRNVAMGRRPKDFLKFRNTKKINKKPHCVRDGLLFFLETFNMKIRVRFYIKVNQCELGFC